ncbi:hypothetical protein ACN6QZ_19315, partial [Acinetobacter baumannii]
RHTRFLRGSRGLGDVYKRQLTLALDQIDNPSTILPPALLIALTTSLGSFFTCLFAYTIFDKESVKGKISLQLFMNALKNIAKAFLALTIGVILGILLTQLHTHIPFNLSLIHIS